MGYGWWGGQGGGAEAVGKPRRRRTLHETSATGCFGGLAARKVETRAARTARSLGVRHTGQASHVSSANCSAARSSRTMRSSAHSGSRSAHSTNALPAMLAKQLMISLMPG